MRSLVLLDPRTQLFKNGNICSRAKYGPDAHTSSKIFFFFLSLLVSESPRCLAFMPAAIAFSRKLSYSQIPSSADCVCAKFVNIACFSIWQKLPVNEYPLSRSSEICKNNKLKL